MTGPDYYVKLAHVHGAREAWNLALYHDAEFLGRLAKLLRAIDPPRQRVRGYMVDAEGRFELKSKDKRLIARKAIEAGIGERRGTWLSGVSHATWWRIKNEVRDASKLAPESRSSSGKSVSKNGRPSHGSNLPIFQFSGDSGASMDLATHREMLRLLGTA
jgi:hypothetical protein